MQAVASLRPVISSLALVENAIYCSSRTIYSVVHHRRDPWYRVWQVANSHTPVVFEIEFREGLLPLAKKRLPSFC